MKLKLFYNSPRRDVVCDVTRTCRNAENIRLRAPIYVDMTAYWRVAEARDLADPIASAQYLLCFYFRSSALYHITKSPWLTKKDGDDDDDDDG